MAHQFTKDSGGFISHEDARTYTKNYRENNLSTAVQAYYFGINKIKEVINQDNVIGVRIYNAYIRNKDSSLSPQVIFVAVNEDGKDIVDTNKILDFSFPCPPFCPENGKSLNK